LHFAFTVPVKEAQQYAIDLSIYETLTITSILADANREVQRIRKQGVFLRKKNYKKDEKYLQAISDILGVLDGFLDFVSASGDGVHKPRPPLQDKFRTGDIEEFSNVPLSRQLCFQRQMLVMHDRV